MDPVGHTQLFGQRQGRAAFRPIADQQQRRRSPLSQTVKNMDHAGDVFHRTEIRQMHDHALPVRGKFRFAGAVTARSETGSINKIIDDVYFAFGAELRFCFGRQVAGDGGDPVGDINRMSSNLEKRFIRKNGSVLNILLYVNCNRDQEGEVSYFLASLVDITESKKAQAALQHMQKLESIGTLAGGIAHDFNNLLSGIYGNI